MSNPDPQTTPLSELAETIYTLAMKQGLINDMRGWNEKNSKKGDWQCHTPAIPMKEKMKWMKVAEGVRNAGI